MKNFIKMSFFLALMTETSLAVSWKIALEENKDLMGEKTYNLLTKQRKSFKDGSLPKIADQDIKKIPIKESGEYLVDILTKNNPNPRIQMLPNPEKPCSSPDCNSGFKPASKVRNTLYEKLTNTLTYLDVLAPHFGFKPGKVSIKVFEGLRDLETQQMIFDYKQQQIRVANPHMSEEEVFQETSQWVSPLKDNVPVHATGAAIDIRLFDEESDTFVEMGPFGVWGDNKAAPTFSTEITEKQLKNRLFLLIAATQANLVNYPYEYWHFSSGDRYAAFWLEPDPSKRESLYSAQLPTS